jgi:hypothetical protein
MALSDRQLDLIYSLTVVVGGGLIIYAATEWLFPRMEDGGPDFTDPLTLSVTATILLVIAVGLLLINLRARKELKEVWSVKAGETHQGRMHVKRGHVLSGTATEASGLEFDLRIMTPAQANRFTGGDREAGSLRDYSGKAMHMVKWTAPDDGNYRVVVSAHRKNKDRTVEVDLSVTRGRDRKEGLGENELSVLNAVRRTRDGSVKDIAGRSGLSEGTVRKYLDSLRRKGMVKRSETEGRISWKVK